MACNEKTAAKEQPPATAVRVKPVEMSPINKGIRYSASIEPLKQVELAFKVGGYVDRVHQMRGVDGRMRDLQAGDLVAKGTILAGVRRSDFAVKLTQAESQASESRSTLDTTQAQYAESQSSVASGKAQLAESEAALQKSRLDFERARNLFSTQSTTKADFDAAKAQLESVEARRAASSSQVAMLEAKQRAAEAQIETVRAKMKGAQAMVTEAAIPLEDASLRAPMSGVILQKSLEKGTLISAGKSSFVLADLSSVKAIFGAPDQTVGKLKLGGTLTVTTESLPGVELHGQITRISPAADSKSRVFDVEVTIPNPNQALKAGMIASLEVAADSPAQSSPVVPVSAIVRDRNHPEHYAVFIVEERSGKPIARSRVVKLGAALGNTMVVLEGVSAGDRVITSGATLVIDGQGVQVIP